MEDVTAFTGIKLRHVGGCLPLEKTTADDAAGRGTGNEMKKLPRWLPGRVLDTLENASRDDSSDTPTVDAQDTYDVVGHFPSRAYFMLLSLCAQLLGMICEFLHRPLSESLRFLAN